LRYEEQLKNISSFEKEGCIKNKETNHLEKQEIKIGKHNEET